MRLNIIIHLLWNSDLLRWAGNHYFSSLGVMCIISSLPQHSGIRTWYLVSILRGQWHSQFKIIDITSALSILYPQFLQEIFIIETNFVIIYVYSIMHLNKCYSYAIAIHYTSRYIHISAPTVSLDFSLFHFLAHETIYLCLSYWQKQTKPPRSLSLSLSLSRKDIML